MPSRWRTEREAVLATSREMVAKGLVVGPAGNVSMRVRDNGRDLLAITPSRKQYEALTPDDIQVVDFEADPVEGDLVPSVETLMHVAVYRARPDVGAVVHTHSVYATVLAVARLDLPPLLDEMVTSVGGDVKVAEYAFPSSEALAQEVGRSLGKRNAVILANHGVVGAGRDLRQALAVCELVERAAQVYVLARALGRVNLLPEDVVSTEKELFKMMQLGPGGAA